MPTYGGRIGAATNLEELKEHLSEIGRGILNGA